jgi:tripartite-type tricarboxylate transporter receptor subunit TctC
MGADMAKVTSRRILLCLSGGVTVTFAMSRIAAAQAYPTRPVHIVVGFPAGSGPDIIARVLAQRLSERLSQAFVIDNRPGGGTLIATDDAIRSDPDGYTLLFIPTGVVISSIITESRKIDFAHDITGVAFLGDVPLVIVVNPELPAKTIPELIAYAKANPGKINFATPGIGTAPHVFGELFKMKAGIDMVHVPYKGSYTQDLLGGQVQLAIPALPAVLELIKTGKLRALAIAGTARSAALPDVPALSELVPGYDARNWMGIGAPRGTTATAIETLNKEINAVLAEPAIKDRLSVLGLDPRPMTAAEFTKLIAGDAERWDQVAKLAGIRAD